MKDQFCGEVWQRAPNIKIVTCVCKVTNGDAPNAKDPLYNVCFRSFKTAISSLRKMLSPTLLIRELNCFDSNLKYPINQIRTIKIWQVLHQKIHMKFQFKKLIMMWSFSKKNHACFDYSPSSNIGISFMGF